MSQNHHHRAPPTPEEPPPPPPSVTNISNHFSRLYLNHKAHSSDPISTIKSLTKSLSHNTTKKTHYYYTNKPVKKHDDHEPQDNIKRAIVVSNKTPINKHEHQDLKDLKKHGFDEKTKKSHGYEVKKEALLGVVGPTRGIIMDRRKSFGSSSSSKSEMSDFFACNGVKVVSVDMPPYMQIHVVDVTRKTYDSLEKFTAKTLALTLKKEFDGVYGPAWHCIVGSSFGSFVTHSVGGFMYFSMDQKLYVLLFKTAVQRAHS